MYLRLFLRVRACIRLQARDKLLQDATAQSATLKAGDAVVFDSRLLHAGTGNLPAAEGFFLSMFSMPEERCLRHSPQKHGYTLLSVRYRLALSFL